MARDDYIEVKDRIQQFLDKYPEGSLQGSWEWTERLGEPWIVYRAEAYRTPDDPRPGIGYAWEPVPGRTPFTRDSELMVAETSAWGRATAAIGIAVHKGVASGDEVRAAEARRVERTRPTEPEPDQWTTPDPAQGAEPRDFRVSAKQLGMIKRLCDEAGITDKAEALGHVNDLLASVSLPTVNSLHELPKHHASSVISRMKGDPSIV